MPRVVAVEPPLPRRARVRSTAAAALFVTAASASCGFFPDVSHFTGGSASIDDAGDVTDTGARSVDGSLKSDTGAGNSPCALAHDFCDDFDSNDNYLAKWTDKVLSGTGSINPTTSALSLPRAAETRMGRRNGNANDAYAYFFKSIPGWKKIVVEFDAFMAAPAWQAGDINSGIFYVDFAGTNPSRDLTVSVGEDYVSLGGSADAPGPALQMNSWVHYKFQVDPLKGTVSATIGSASYNDSWTPSATNPTDPKTNVHFGIFGYNKPAPEFRVVYDNITIDIVK